MKSALARGWDKMQHLNLWRTFRLIWSVAPRDTFFSIAFILLENGCVAFDMLLLKKMIDYVGAYKAGIVASSNIYRLLVLFVTIGITYIVIRFFSVVYTEKQASKISCFVEDKLHGKAVGLDLAYYDDARLFDNLSIARHTKPYNIVLSMMEIFKGIVFMVAICSVLFALNWVLPIILVALLVPLLYVKLFFSHKQHLFRQRMASEQRSAEYLSSLMLESAYAKEVRSYSLGDYLRRRYLQIKGRLEHQNLSLARKRNLAESAILLITALGFFGSIFYMVVQIVQLRMDIGSISLFLVTFPQAFNLLQYLSSSTSTLYQHGIAMQAVYAVLDIHNLMPNGGLQVPPSIQRPVLRMENVYFHYPGSGRDVLQDVSLELHAGKIVALVGENGAGKSTIIKLLSRLYDPVEGNITLNGTDIRDYVLQDYRQYVRPVFQDFGRYQFSIRENIFLGNVNAPFNHSLFEQVIHDIKIQSFAAALAQGYDTLISNQYEDGEEISIGQWQKIAIARALYGNAPFVILDEPTSALDVRSENDIFDAIRDKLHQKATLLISHRKSTIQQADYIYVLVQGRIVQGGTHQELMADTEGAYAAMFRGKNGFNVH